MGLGKDFFLVLMIGDILKWEKKNKTRTWVCYEGEDKMAYVVVWKLGLVDIDGKTNLDSVSPLYSHNRSLLT